MTAADGGPALAASPADRVGPTRVAIGVRRRTVLALATVEAGVLFRSLLVLAGLLAGGIVIWILIHSVQPLWWNVAWQIGYGQAVLGMAVLTAAHLGAGRARRDGMADLYGSFPATVGTRTLGQLTGLAGALPASLLLIGGTAAVVQLLGPVGVPSIAALAAGLLLVIAAGAAGIAIATRFPHPLAGVLAGLALFVPVVESNNINGAGSWLLPWYEPGQLRYLPGPLAGYPPAATHAAELAAIAVLAGSVALAVTANSARARGLLATAAALAIAVTCFAGGAQLKPIPAADLNRLVAEIADPASVQHCTTANHVRFCLYPGFGRDLSSLEAPVSGVLAYLPGRPGQPLTVRQVAFLDIGGWSIAHGHPNRQLSRWNAQVQKAPGGTATASAIYLPVGSWPASGGRLADAHFDLALATAEWAVGLAPTTSSNSSGGQFQSCVPLDQAREAIAIWLAIRATRPPASELQAGLGTRAGYAEVRNTLIATWADPGSSVGGYLTPEGAAPQTTAAGYVLARAMTSLPVQKVGRVLAGSWARWLNWRTTDVELASALGIPMPSVPAPPAAATSLPPGAPPGTQSPLCTT